VTLTEALKPHTATMRHVAATEDDKLPADVYVGARHGLHGTRRTDAQGVAGRMTVSP
jgi:hypothetical protein